MRFAVGLFDHLFGEKVSLEVPTSDGQTRRRTVTRRWLEQMKRKKKMQEVDGDWGEIAERLGTLIVQVASNEVVTFQDVWKRQLDNKTQVALFLDNSILLIAITDRLASAKFGSATRNQIMNAVVNTVRSCFANQRQHFGKTEQERGAYFEQVLADRFQKLAKCSSIMGRGKDSVVFFGATHLVETFLGDVAESEVPDVLLKTGKVFSLCVSALMTTQPFKDLN